MKHYVRTVACGTALVAAALLGACGGKQTMASKSAAAYDDARKKGITPSAGEHGGHEAGGAASTDSTSPMPDMDHSQMPGMDHRATATRDMAGMDHSSMPGMDHSQMSGMKQGSGTSATHDMAGMDHSSMAGMDHSQMSGMKHGGGSPTAAAHDMAGMNHASMPGMPGMQHATAAPLQIAAPTTNAAIARTQPAATLRQDEFDAPAPIAVDEAGKAGGSMTPSTTPAHEDNATPPQQPSHEHQHGDAGGAR